jgi:adenosylcobyric acid synthase
MQVAGYLNVATILVVDINLGGAFAHVGGTLQLLEPKDRALMILLPISFGAEIVIRFRD